MQAIYHCLQAGTVILLNIFHMAVPAWADVYIIATDMGGGEVVISSDTTSELNLIRAFALDIRLDNNTCTTEITDTYLEYM